MKSLCFPIYYNNLFRIVNNIVKIFIEVEHKWLNYLRTKCVYKLKVLKSLYQFFMITNLVEKLTPNLDENFHDRVKLL